MGNGSTYASYDYPWAAPRPVAIDWVPVVVLLAAIAGESTRIAGTSTTLHLLIGAVRHAHLHAQLTDLVLANWRLRKLGHFSGYGLLAALTMRGWQRHALRGRQFAWQAVTTQAASLGVLCAGAVAMLDEWHQSFLPGRSASIDDVALDTFGAATCVTLYFWFSQRRQKRIAGRHRSEEHVFHKVQVITTHSARNGKLRRASAAGSMLPPRCQ